MEWLLAVFIGTAAGILSGLFGIGGGIVLVPMLIFFMGFSQRLAQGTSLGALLLPVGLFAAWRYHKEGNTNLGVSAVIAITLAIGAYFGAILAGYVPDLVLKRGFGVLLSIVALKFLFF